jgi:hypothetical protein
MKKGKHTPVDLGDEEASPWSPIAKNNNSRRSPSRADTQRYYNGAGRCGSSKVVLALATLLSLFAAFAYWTLSSTGGEATGGGFFFGADTDTDAPIKQSLASSKSLSSSTSRFVGNGKSQHSSDSGGDGYSPHGEKHDVMKALLEEHAERKKVKKKEDEESINSNSNKGNSDNANNHKQKKKDEEKKTKAAAGDGGRDGEREKEKKKLRKKKNQEEHVELSKAEPKVHNYHPNVSPRSGSDISGAQNQLSILRCPNQSKCIVPELQLKPKNKVYLCKHPVRHGVRFYFLVREGLLLHPNVILVDEEHVDEADYVFYLPGSSPWHRTECTNSSLADKLIVMDEFDGHNLFYPYKTKEEVIEVYGPERVWYYMYFKRSFVARRDGKFIGHPHLNRPDVYPMTYAIAEAYVQEKFNFVREIEVLCTLRGNARMSTRLRVQNWIAEYTDEKKLKNAVTKQVNGATRTTVSKSYFAQMYNAQIIVTVNPANWEGDFRLWESFATGALIFVDPIFVPHGYPLQDGIHAVFYDNNNRTELFEKLDYYRANSEVARKIAINGYLHAMKYHRTVNLIDYVMRSAHLKASLIKQAAKEEGHEDKKHIEKVGSRLRDRPGDEEVPTYTYTAQYLNHQTADQGEDIKKSDRPGVYKAVVGLHHDGIEEHSLSHMEPE